MSVRKELLKKIQKNPKLVKLKNGGITGELVGVDGNLLEPIELPETPACRQSKIREVFRLPPIKKLDDECEREKQREKEKNKAKDGKIITDEEADLTKAYADRNPTEFETEEDILPAVAEIPSNIEKTKFEKDLDYDNREPDRMTLLEEEALERKKQRFAKILDQLNRGK